MLGMWLAGQDDTPVRGAAPQTDQSVRAQVRELEHRVQRLSLLNQALWELLCERLDLNDELFERKVQEVDLRDGIEDGRMTETALRCPKCGRVSSSKHWKCLYCGVNFKRPVMG